MKTNKIADTALLFTFFIGITKLNAQTDAWNDGGSLQNVDLCDHDALDEFGFSWLYWDVDNVLAAYEVVGMTCANIYIVIRSLVKTNLFLDCFLCL